MRDRKVNRARRGSTTSEYMLMLSAVVVGVTAAAVQFIPAFSQGVDGLAADVKALLSGDGTGPDAGGSSTGGSGSSNGGSSSSGGSADSGGSSDTSGGSSSGDTSGGSSGDTSGGDTSGGDTSGGTTSDGGESSDGETDDDNPDCPYVYDENSDRWRDPETGKYVSGSAAADAGC